MKGPFAAISADRLNGLVLLLSAVALASPQVEPLPGTSAPIFWTARAVGIGLAVAALAWTRVQRWAFGGIVLFMVLVPCALQMHYRAWTAPQTWCHDSVLQFEEAIRMVREKKNPYKEDFSGTALTRWNGWKDNPAIHHFVYPPLLLYVSVPVEMASRAVLWKMPANVDKLGDRFYDQRIVVLGFFLGFLGLVWRYLRDHPHRIAIAALVVLNPWVGPFVIEGRNDVAMLFWVAAAWIGYESDRTRVGHLLLGVAIATKTLLLPMIPLVAYAHRREWPVCLALLLAPLALTSMPFLIADPSSFVNDLVGAPAGLGPYPFQIRGPGGLGFANLVLALGWVKSDTAYFPFSIFQLAAYVPCLVAGARSLKREPGNGGVFLWSAGAIFAALFFGRFIHDNYVGALLSIAVISQTARGTSPAANSTSAGS